MTFTFAPFSSNSRVAHRICLPSNPLLAFVASGFGCSPSSWEGLCFAASEHVSERRDPISLFGSWLEIFVPNDLATTSVQVNFPLCKPRKHL